MRSPGERRGSAREEAALLQGQLTAFGELLAGHPFASDRPGTTHVMAVEYARALDAYERATREAARDPALSRAELDEGLAALNRLNALLVGARPAAEETEPPDRTSTTRAPDKRPAKGDGPARQRSAGTAARAPAGASRAPAAARPSGKPGPGGSGRPAVQGGRARPRLRERFTPQQLLVRAGLAALACYCVAVGFLGNWLVAVLCFVFANFGVGMAGAGGLFTLMPLAQTWRAVKGGRVEAEYRRTEKTYSTSTPWEQHYVHRDADGQELTYRRGVPSASLVPLPTRRLWLVAGRKPALITSTDLLLTPLLLVIGVPLLLGGTALTLAAVPGALIWSLAGDPWW